LRVHVTGDLDKGLGKLEADIRKALSQ
jgi:hypothetical protein